MTVEQTNTIDVVSLNEPSGIVVLTISDHLDWTDSRSHQEILQRKFNAYLAAIESGEFERAYPVAQGKKLQIKVVLKYRPDRSGNDFLSKARIVIESAGVEFQSELFAESYDN